MVKEKLKNVLINCLIKYKINILFGAGISAEVYETLGGDSINEIIINSLREYYNFTDRKYLVEDNKNSLVWISKIVKQIENKDKINFENLLTLLRNYINIMEEMGDYLTDLVKIEKYLKQNLISGMQNDNNSEEHKNNAINSISNFLSVMYIIWKRYEKKFFNIENYSINIFTTNYDLLVEEALEKNNYIYHDGFSGNIQRTLEPSSYDNFVAVPEIIHGKNKLRFKLLFNLFKLHGSINWERVNSNIRHSINTIDPFIVEPSKGKFGKIILEYNMYMLLQKFKDSLYKKDSCLLIFGTSLNDEHLNQIILDSLLATDNYVFYFPYNQDDINNIKPLKENNIKNNFIIVDPEWFSLKDELTDKWTKNLNDWTKIISNLVLDNYDWIELTKRIEEENNNE